MNFVYALGMISFRALLLAFVCITPAATACSNNDPAPADSGTPADTGTGSDASSVGDSGEHSDASIPEDAGTDMNAGDATVADDAAAGSDAGVDAGPTYGYCTKPCGTVADCCPAGSPECPSSTYPNNYMCIEGACHSPVCATTADCMGVDPATDCMILGGSPICTTPCTTNGDCSEPFTCSGTSDDGRHFCLVTGGTGCSDDASCHGYGRCVDRLCVCETAADCDSPTFNACAR